MRHHFSISTGERSERERGVGGWKRGEEPNHQWWHAKRKLSRNTYTLRMRWLHALAPTRVLQSELGDKISASDLSREVCEDCVVGWEGGERGRERALKQRC